MTIINDVRLRVAQAKETELASIEASCSQYLELLPLVSDVFSQICSECEVTYNAEEATVSPYSPVLEGLGRKLNDIQGNQEVALIFETKLKAGEIKVNHKPNPLYFSASYDTEIEDVLITIRYKSMGIHETYFGIGLKGSTKVHQIAWVKHDQQIEELQGEVKFHQGLQDFLDFLLMP